MIKLFYNDVFKNYFLLTLTLFIEEVILRIALGFSIIDISMVRILIGINLISLLCSAIFSFFGRTAGNFLTFIVGLICTLYAFIQVGFYNILGMFVSVSTYTQVGAVKDFIVEYIKGFSFVHYLLFVPLLLLGLFYITCDYRIKVLEKNDEIDFADKFHSEERKKLNDAALFKKKRAGRRVSKINAIIISLMFLGAYYFTLITPAMENRYQFRSNMKLFNQPELSNLAINKLGYTGYMIADIKNMVAPDNKIDSKYTNSYKKKEQVDSDYKRFLDDTIWEQIMKEDNNTGVLQEKNINSYKTLNNYYISQEITDKNDFTGFFKNKNLIVISLSSINNLIINEEYFPNIYKLYDEGWAWDNNYSIRSSCSGIDNEVVSMASLYPIYNQCSSVKYSNNTYPESLFNLFKNAEYEVSSFHNYSEQFYNRNIIHTNLGSDKYYGVQALGIPYNSKYSEWPSDVALMEKFLKNTSNQKKFMSLIVTSATNIPYGVSSEVGDKHLDLFADKPYSIEVRRYLSKMKELDIAIGKLIDGLEDQKKLADTVIVLYSAHTPYGFDSKTLSTLLETDVNKEKNIDKSPFIIYNTEMQGQKFKEYTSTVNIVPTIANLFNLDYDPRRYAGKDILATYYENRVIFADGSWKDNKVYYDAINDTVNYYDVNKTYSDTEFKNINEEVKNRIFMSNLAIKTNYFNHFDAKKEEYKIKDIEEQKLDSQE